jgi:hypothetical protein
MMMKFFQKIGWPARVLVGISVVLLLYGYLCRLGLYFFWESLVIGWELLFVGAIFALVSLRRDKKRNGKKAIGEGILIGFLIFLLSVQGIIYVVVPRTDAFRAAETFVRGNADIKKQVGNVTGLSMMPVGNFQESGSESQGMTGSATMELTVKGDLRFKDYILYLDKLPGTDWQVQNIQ